MEDVLSGNNNVIVVFKAGALMLARRSLEATPNGEQDGVAPQCPVENIGSRRSYLPDNVVKGFVSSHSIGNYKWIFTEKTKGDKYYVTPRN
jgi:hypothetical protein